MCIATLPCYPRSPQHGDCEETKKATHRAPTYRPSTPMTTPPSQASALAKNSKGTKRPGPSWEQARGRRRGKGLRLRARARASVEVRGEAEERARERGDARCCEDHTGHLADAAALSCLDGTFSLALVVLCGDALCVPARARGVEAAVAVAAAAVHAAHATPALALELWREGEVVGRVVEVESRVVEVGLGAVEERVVVVVVVVERIEVGRR